MRRLLALAILCCVPCVGPARATKRAVGISIFEFRPARVVITAGGTVTWRWNGPDTDHSVTARDRTRAFDSDPGRAAGRIDHPVGFTFGRTFPRPGTYRYFCKVHRSMRGVVVVRPRARVAERQSA